MKMDKWIYVFIDPLTRKSRFFLYEGESEPVVAQLSPKFQESNIEGNPKDENESIGCANH